MKRVISIILTILLVGIIPSFADNSVLELTPNEIIYMDLPSGWHMDEAKILYNADGTVGYIDGRSYDEPLTDVSTASLNFLKAKILNNIMLVENVGSGLHLYEAETTSGIASYVFTIVNSSYDYMFLACIYQSRMSYATLKSIAQTIMIEYTPGELIAEYITETIGEEEPELIDTEQPEEDEIDYSLGNVLSTDIIAYIDDMPIQSYNVGGKTVIVVEDLSNYGFDVQWNPDERTLTASISSKPEITPEYINETIYDEANEMEIGTVVGNIYATDIITEINGREYETYNMNGQTVVVIEDLGDRTKDRETNIFNSNQYSSGGFKTIWDAETRTVWLYCLRPNDIIKTWAGNLPVKESTAIMTPIEYAVTEYSFANDIVTVIEVDGRIFIDLRKYCEITNIGCGLTDNNSFILTTDQMYEDIENSMMPIEHHIEEGMILPLNITISCGDKTARSNNSNIAYYYTDGAVMVDLSVLMNIIS